MYSNKYQETYNFFFTFRSKTDGNCLFSSVSLLVSGDNKLVDTLRSLCSIELFENRAFYANHPLLRTLFETKREYFSSFNSVFEVTVSSKATGDSLEGKVKSEAIRMCHPGQWGSFLCLLALSSVTKRNIVSVYPSVGAIKYRMVLNNLIEPRAGISFGEIHIMFTQHDFSEGQRFHPNHFVPLLKIFRKVTLPAIPTIKSTKEKKTDLKRKQASHNSS